MFRLSYRLYRLASWLRYTLPRRFTPAGSLGLLILVSTGAIGVDLDRTVAYQGFALVFCVLGVSMTAAVFFRGRFRVQRFLPRYGSVGQTLEYRVTVFNSSSRRFDHLEVLECLADPRPGLAEFIAMQREGRRRRGRRLRLTGQPPLDFRQAQVRPAPLPVLAARGQAEAKLHLVPLKRGPLRLNAVAVARTDPFGWFRGFVRVANAQTLTVLPRRYPLPPLALPGNRQYQQGGVALASGIGESEEFLALRDYRPGDPKRHIHWRSFARTGRPIVKEFEDEFFVRHALVLDTFDVGSSAAFEEAISIAASFACTLGTQESLLDVLFAGPQAVCFTTGRGLGRAEQALELLAALQPCPKEQFERLPALVLRHARSVCGCIVILLAWDEPRRALVRQLRRRGVPLLVMVVAEPKEAALLRQESTVNPSGNFQVLETGRVAAGLLELNGGLQ